MSEPLPCCMLDYCPYGVLVELFPLQNRERNLIRKSDWQGTELHFIEPNPDAIPCKRFGHDCPVYYIAEKLPPVLDSGVYQHREDIPMSQNLYRLSSVFNGEQPEAST